jgi:hypothetical protein
MSWMWEECVWDMCCRVNGETLLAMRNEWVTVVRSAIGYCVQVSLWLCI